MVRMGAGAKAGVGGALAVASAIGISLFGDVAETQEPAPTPTPTIAPVDWEAADDDARAKGLDGARPEQSEAAVAATGGAANAGSLEVPLLFPTSLVEAGKLGQLDSPLNVIAEQYAYSAEAKAAPRSYVVQGTRFVFEVESINFEQDALGPEDVDVETMEYGVEATFERYGVYYSVAIFCADPVGDAQCADEETVRRLASEMELIQ